MTKNKKYLKAAKLITLNVKAYNFLNIRRIGCCTALFKVNQTDYKFTFLFKPVKAEINSFWWHNPDEGITKKTQLARTLALLLMYEMGEE